MSYSLLKVTPYVLIALLIIFGISYKSQITGFVTKILPSGEIEQTEELNLSYNQSNQYQWIPLNIGKITSVKLSGLISGVGTAKVYLISGDYSYNIIDSNNIISTITEEDMLPSEVKTNSSSNENMTAVINYNSGTLFDVDDNGLEMDNSVVDFNVNGTNFSMDVNEDGLCTRWKIFNVETEDSSYECNGATRCCNYLSLIPQENSWNAIYNVYKGKNVAGRNNIIGAQIVYVNENLTAYASLFAQLPARFASITNKPFVDICKDTCSFLFNTTSNNSQYYLVFELNDANIKIDNITYTIINENNLNNTDLLLLNITQNLSMNATNTTLQEDCKCPIEGNWILESGNSCIITKDCNLNENSLILNGPGSFVIDNATISNVGNVIRSGGVKVIKKHGGKIIR